MASVMQATDRLMSAADKASLHIEGDPHALIYAPVVRFSRPGLRKQDSEVARMQVEMDRARRMLAKIQVE